MFLPSAQRRMSAVGRMEKQTAHPNPNLEPIEKPHVAYRVSRGTTPAYTPHERRTKWQRTLPDRTRTSIRVRPLLKPGSHQTTKQLRNRARPAGAEPRWPPKALYRQQPAGGPDAKKAWGNRPLPNPGGRRRRCTDSGRPVGPTPRKRGGTGRCRIQVAAEGGVPTAAGRWARRQESVGEPAVAESRWPPKAVYRQRTAGGPDAKKGDFYEWLEETHFRSTGPDRRVCDGQPGSLREGA